MRANNTVFTKYIQLKTVIPTSQIKDLPVTSDHLKYFWFDKLQKYILFIGRSTETLSNITIT